MVFSINVNFIKLTAAFLFLLIPLSGFSELVCERPDGCRWIGSTCQDCIERPPPKPQLKVPSEIHHNTYNTTNHISIHPKVVQHEFVITRPPTLQFSNSSITLSGLSRDSSGWRFRARVGSYECLMPPLRSGDKRGVFSCGGVRTNYFVFF